MEGHETGHWAKPLPPCHSHSPSGPSSRVAGTAGRAASRDQRPSAVALPVRQGVLSPSPLASLGQRGTHCLPASSSLPGQGGSPENKVEVWPILDSLPAPCTQGPRRDVGTNRPLLTLNPAHFTTCGTLPTSLLWSVMTRRVTLGESRDFFEPQFSLSVEWEW